jgi:hypothetical protein
MSRSSPDGGLSDCLLKLKDLRTDSRTYGTGIVVSVIAVDEESHLRGRNSETRLMPRAKARSVLKRCHFQTGRDGFTWQRPPESNSRSDNVVKPSVKVVEENFPAIRSWFLIETGGQPLLASGEIGLPVKQGSVPEV